MDGLLEVRTLLSGASFLFTAYFWFVKARKERPNLEFHQLSNYRVVCRRHPDQEGMKRLCIQQLDTGGVLMVNHSTRQSSVVLFTCFLMTDDGEIEGDWGYGGDDKPPWNVGPESTIAFSPACFFDIPEHFDVPEDPRFRLQFITAGGSQFSHVFTKEAPRAFAASESTRRAA